MKYMFTFEIIDFIILINNELTNTAIKYCLIIESNIRLIQIDLNTINRNRIQIMIWVLLLNNVLTIDLDIILVQFNWYFQFMIIRLFMTSFMIHYLLKTGILLLFIISIIFDHFQLTDLVFCHSLVLVLILVLDMLRNDRKQIGGLDIESSLVLMNILLIEKIECLAKLNQELKYHLDQLQYKDKEELILIQLFIA